MTAGKENISIIKVGEREKGDRDRKSRNKRQITGKR